jgi:GAF domain-containing protein
MQQKPAQQPFKAEPEDVTQEPPLGGSVGGSVREKMDRRLYASATFEAAITTILAEVVALHRAEFGNVQLAAGAKLIIVAKHGFQAPFLSAFREVLTTDGCACGRAWQTGRPIVVPDVNSDEAFAPFREIAKEAGYRAVQSTPLVASDGMALGMVSSQFANPHVPTNIEMAICKAYCATAADHLQTLLVGSRLETKARQLHEALYADVRGG